MYIPSNVNTNCGIYRIKNMRNGKCYIGSSKNLLKRKRTHFWKLQKNIHHCEHLQSSYNKEDDKSIFEFQIFIYCKEQDLIPMEQSCINIMKPEYNSSMIAGKIEYTDDIINKMKLKKKEFFESEKADFFRKNLKEKRKHFLSSPDGEKFKIESRERNKKWLNSLEGKEWIERQRPISKNRVKKYWGSDAGKIQKEIHSQRMSGKNNPRFGIKGENHPLSKLTQKQADEIRDLIFNKKMKRKHICDLYGIGLTLLDKIRSNKVYVISNKEPENG